MRGWLRDGFPIMMNLSLELRFGSEKKIPILINIVIEDNVLGYGLKGLAFKAVINKVKAIGSTVIAFILMPDGITFLG